MRWWPASATTPSPPCGEQVATALFNKYFTLGQLDRRRSKIVRSAVTAWVNRDLRFDQLGRPEKAVAVDGETVALVGDAPELPVGEQVPEARRPKADMEGGPT